MKSNGGSFFVQHPWLTFFLGLAIVNGVVTAVRGYDPAVEQLVRGKPYVRGTYR
jgi:hypothetical protein